MNFKKRVNGSWTDTSHYIHNTSTDTIATFPTVLYPTGTTAMVGLKGQTLQSSIPSPTSPVMPQGTGERTGNLFDKVFASGYSVAFDGYPIPYTPDNSRCATLEAIDVSNQNTVTFSYTSTVSDNKRFIYSLFNGNTLVTRESNKSSGTTIDVSQGNKLYLCVYSNLESVNAVETTSNIMLNSGSTPLPYEPYGYKIPISSASTTTPVYLGEVETTRKIIKYEFDGSEAWTNNSASATDYIYFLRALKEGLTRYDMLCSHLPIATSGMSPTNAGVQLYSSRTTLLINVGTDVMDAQPSGNTVAGLKEYLATQYAAGTPVTVWYVLATPETGIVNEPIRKIGSYADEISGITIPVTAGANTISVDTALQPSEVTVNYKGWHPVADVHERENGAWT